MNKQRKLVFAGAGATATAAALALGLRRQRRPELGVLRTVDSVALPRFAGRWFEIARYPTRYERRCAKNATADYSLRGSGSVYMEHRCTTKDGKIHVAHGMARVVDAWSRAKMRVKYGRFGPGADYWIIDLDEDYGWAVVGEPKRERLWILSRTPGLDESLYGEICGRLVTQGYDPNKLVRSPQDGA